MNFLIFFFFSSRRRHTRCREVSWARRCVQETGINAEYMGIQMDDTMSTKDFLEKIAIDLKRDPKTMEAVISKLEEEWYDSVGSLRKISDETMSQLGIPKRLQTEIKERLQKPTSVEEAKAPIIPPEPLKSPAKNEWQLILMMITDEIVLHEKIRKTLGIFEKIIKLSLIHI
eukprot:TRINITY_DN28940_c0_g1_i1.p1 TRINITY_DN28940_c0_g1~~TRINITY_DN28940_c0_g1_i1.p1  ORF type:complete len:172 (-),score=70.03 TRINITY_DN28940_c0_g1_i1:153-668(-)